MVNHMAQGAATSMEDGAFLARTLAKHVEGKITLPEAIEIYEKGRMPKAYFKQQVSFLNGAIWHLPDGPLQEVCPLVLAFPIRETNNPSQARDKAMSAELRGNQFMRSPNLYGDPDTTLR